MPIKPDQLSSLDDMTPVRGFWHTSCAYCGLGYIGRADAQTCSTNCGAYIRKGLSPKPAPNPAEGRISLADQISALAHKLASG